MYAFPLVCCFQKNIRLHCTADGITAVDKNMTKKARVQKRGCPKSRSLSLESMKEIISKQDEILTSIRKLELCVHDICVRMGTLEEVDHSFQSTSIDVSDDTAAKGSESESLSTKQGDDKTVPINDAEILDSKPVPVNPVSSIGEEDANSNDVEPAREVLKSSQLTEAFENGYKQALIASFQWVINIKTHLDSIRQSGTLSDLVMTNPHMVIEFIESFELGFNEHIDITERNPIGDSYDSTTMERYGTELTNKREEDDTVVSVLYGDKYYYTIGDCIIRKQRVIVKRFDGNMED